MKKQIFILLFSFFLVIFLAGCKSSSEKRNERTKEIATRLAEIDKSVEEGKMAEADAKKEREALEKELDEIAKDVSKEIDGKDGKEEKDGKDDSGERDESENDDDGSNDQKQYPGWAADLGLHHPDGMEIVSSTVVSESDPNGYDLVTFDYKGTYDQAMKQAEILAKDANLSIEPVWKQMRDLAKDAGKLAEQYGQKTKVPIEEIKGIMYSNVPVFELTTTKSSVKYVTLIVVDDKGKMTVTCFDKEKAYDKIKGVIPQMPSGGLDIPQMPSGNNQ